MIRLAEKNIRAAQRQSSKGDQLKLEDKGFWYKADYLLCGNFMKTQEDYNAKEK